MSELAERKRSLRRKCFKAVKEMSLEEKQAASLSVCDQIRAMSPFQKAGTVFAYLPLSSEPDLTSLFADSKTWGFSRVLSDDQMEFRKVTNFEDDVIEGGFKILEPNPEVCPLIEPVSADLVLIPGVGFSAKTGNRLGRGKGHYDRYLERLLKTDKPPTLVGVCFGPQICEVEAEPHDIAMDRVVFG